MGASPTKPQIRGSSREGERRCITAQAQLRASPDGKTLTGYAAVYNQLSLDLGGFREKIAPGAFAPTLDAKEGSELYDVVAVYQHDRSMVLGRRASGTLRLSSDEVGLKVEIDLPDTSVGRDVRELVKRGDISGMSFRFYPFGAKADDWQKSISADGETTWVRTLLSVAFDDVCPVTDPAYPDTSLEVRAKPPEEADPTRAEREAAEAKAAAERQAQIELERDEAAIALA